MRLAAAVFVCAGCNAVFNIQHVGTPIDAVDAPPDVDCATLVDFDGDCIADDVDNCPANPNAGQEDTDSPPDGVGDACDPHPTLPGDRLVLFTAFRDPSAEMTMWTDLNGTPSWTFAPGVAQHTSLSDTVGTIQHSGSVDGAVSVTVEAKFTVQGFKDKLSSAPRYGVIADGTPGSYDGQTCWVTGYNSTDSTMYETAELEDVTTFTRSIDLPITSGGPDVVIRLTRDSGTDVLSCHVIHGAAVNDSIPSVTRSGRTWPTGGPIGVIAREASATVHYVIVYASS